MKSRAVCRNFQKVWRGIFTVLNGSHEPRVLAVVRFDNFVFPDEHLSDFRGLTVSVDSKSKKVAWHGATRFG